jgi:LacI family transcriptional regulator
MKALSGNGAVTLSDIARAAGVSLVTASRALSGSTLVACLTRDKVLAAATEFRYAPNLLARALAQNRSSTLGLIIHEFSNPFYAPMVSAIENAAASRDFLVVLGESQRDVVIERRYMERFRQLRVSGIVVTPTTRDHKHLAALRAVGIPVVVLARRWKQGDFVSVDNEEGGRLAARHLLSRGHRRVAIAFSDNPENTASGRRSQPTALRYRTSGTSERRELPSRTATSQPSGSSPAASGLRRSSRSRIGWRWR